MVLVNLMNLVLSLMTVPVQARIQQEPQTPLTQTPRPKAEDQGDISQVNLKEKAPQGLLQESGLLVMVTKIIKMPITIRTAGARRGCQILTMKFKDLHKRLSHANMTLSAANAVLQAKGLRQLCREFQQLTEEIRHPGGRVPKNPFMEWKLEPPPPLRRRPRQAIAIGVGLGIFSAALGLYNTYNTWKVGQEIGEVQWQLHHEVEIVKRRFEETEKALETLQRGMDQLRDGMELITASTELALNLETLKRELDTLMRGLKRLHEGRLDLGLISFANLWNMYELVQTYSDQQAVVEHPLDLLQLPLTIEAAQDWDTHAVLHIPVAGWKFRIFRLTSAPMNLGAKYFGKLWSGQELLGVSTRSPRNLGTGAGMNGAESKDKREGAENEKKEERFILISPHQLTECMKIGAVHLCTEDRVIMKDAGATCQSAVYRGNWTNVQARCQVKELTEPAASIIGNEAVIYAPIKEAASIYCLNGSVAHRNLSGLTKVPLGPGCRLESQTFEIGRHLEVALHRHPIVLQSDWRQVKLPKTPTLQEVHQQLEKTHQKMRQLDRKLRTLDSDQRTRSSGWLLLVIGSCCLVVLLAIIMLRGRGRCWRANKDMARSGNSWTTRKEKCSGSYPKKLEGEGQYMTQQHSSPEPHRKRDPDSIPDQDPNPDPDPDPDLEPEQRQEQLTWEQEQNQTERTRQYHLLKQAMQRTVKKRSQDYHYQQESTMQAQQPEQQDKTMEQETIRRRSITRSLSPRTETLEQRSLSKTPSERMITSMEDLGMLRAMEEIRVVQEFRDRTRDRSSREHRD